MSGLVHNMWWMVKELLSKGASKAQDSDDKEKKNRNFTCKRVRENEEDKWSAQFEGKVDVRYLAKVCY